MGPSGSGVGLGVAEGRRVIVGAGVLLGVDEGVRVGLADGVDVAARAGATVLFCDTPEATPGEFVAAGALPCAQPPSRNKSASSHTVLIVHLAQSPPNPGACSEFRAGT
jgi:hypothetical protein